MTALPSAHSKVGASVAERFFNCPGSVRECATIPNPSSEYAAEGTVAHTLGASYLVGNPAYAIGDVVEQDGFKIKVTREMQDAVNVYLGHVNGIRVPSDTVMVEQAFHLKELHPDLYGTSDCTIWQPYSRHLHVIDYKHGAGTAVEVLDNKQLRYYALGALVSSGFNAREVTVHIVQPRCPHTDGVIRTETFDAFELMEWSADLLDAVKRTEDLNAPLVPGPHCRKTFCPKMATCPAVQAKTQEMARIEFSAVALPYDPVKLSEALTFAAQAEAWAKSVREFAYAEALRGRTPPGYKLVDKRPARIWKDEKAAQDYLSLCVGEDDYLEPRTLKSPPQVEKAVGKKAFAAIEKEHVRKVSSGTTLATLDDNRPAVRILDAAAEFANVALPETAE